MLFKSAEVEYGGSKDFGSLSPVRLDRSSRLLMGMSSSHQQQQHQYSRRIKLGSLGTW